MANISFVRKNNYKQQSRLESNCHVAAPTRSQGKAELISPSAVGGTVNLFTLPPFLVLPRVISKASQRLGNWGPLTFTILLRPPSLPDAARRRERDSFGRDGGIERGGENFRGRTRERSIAREYTDEPCANWTQGREMRRTLLLLLLRNMISICHFYSICNCCEARKLKASYLGLTRVR